MKSRFDLSFPTNGRHTPAHRGIPTPPRCHPRTSRPSSKKAPAPDEVHASGGVGADFGFQLEDEIELLELDSFTNNLIAQLANGSEISALHLDDTLPSYSRLATEYTDAREEKQDQHNLTKQLVAAAEPVLANASVAECDKQGLLNVTGLAVEKMMQLKMRTSNIRQRLDFLKQVVPQYVINYAKHLGYSEQFCEKLKQLSKSAL